MLLKDLNCRIRRAGGAEVGFAVRSDAQNSFNHCESGSTCRTAARGRAEPAGRGLDGLLMFSCGIDRRFPVYRISAL